jgi:hypothetical protein
MNTYKEGYQAGWASYLEDHKVSAVASEQSFINIQQLAEKAGHALPPQQQGDYWLGYHHGRTAAKTSMNKSLGSYTYSLR